MTESSLSLVCMGPLLGTHTHSHTEVITTLLTERCAVPCWAWHGELLGQDV